MKNAIKTKHNLDFESRAWWLNPKYYEFRVGTCHGLWSYDDKNLIIMAIRNYAPHNGHLDDVFEWFENSCRRYRMNLKVIEITNEAFYLHLINKRGFEPINKENVIKKFKK
ncbi:MAG: hypothetical protein LBC68_11010 [Prevotellaceae bacterium]|jgi:hypothetical protein|nr:hypothetical protein [Prevotellaceae bacterium]